MTKMKHAIHKIICWYLRRCAGAFHCYNYGPTGRYVALMTEDEYANHNRDKATDGRASQALREILISHGSYGDGGNLDKFTRRKCLEVLQASDRRSNEKLSV